MVKKKTRVRKAVIPAAGLGTRFLPVTKSMPKEMLPIIDKPVIHYVVEEAFDSGIDDILIITGRGKRAVEDYFDDAPELRMHLERHGKNQQLKDLNEISRFRGIHFTRQTEPKGLGDAVRSAEKHCGDDPFAVLLGDDIMKDGIPCTRRLIDVFEKTGGSVIAVQEVAKKDISKYGIIKGREEGDNLFLLEDIVEKPRAEHAPSNLGAIGRYVFTPALFPCFDLVTPGAGGEIQLTDAIRQLMKKEDVYAYKYTGKRFDTGDKLGYIETIIEYAMEDEGMKGELGEYIRKKGM
ncbi:UTP--glucose-1-phosphate uridylyltransferase [Methanolinea mesophila]|uniref:UTP--glucose-1-phosphate uridylyltransferase GalU n=1 Tax=Methanolinea mesophila TaxID=547055 RepID=UPI001AE70F6A|nr:UTP--glucose-1-phosphate uridylyltransferase GalU [Methanolinea mesophila]MBP1928364.1 UTP--glucose-1-phosphate uridylyltransferase [Methanolinea mesophila]